jgi:hypothetical protein
MGLKTPVMVGKSFEQFNIEHFWKIFFIPSSRRIYPNGLTLKGRLN